MWQTLANKARVVICTHRPDLREHRGSQQVRRCSTGGRWGKSADVVAMSVEGLLAAGYVWRTYIPRTLAIAAKREEIYCDDTH